MKKHQNYQKNNDTIKSNIFIRIINFVLKLLLWPFRHPFITIPILLLAYFIPTLIGARPTEVHIWYWNKIKSIFSPISEKSIAFIEETGKKFSIPDFSIINKQNNAKEQIVNPNEPQIVRRQTFEKASNQEVAIRVDILAEQKQQIQPTPTAIVEQTHEQSQEEDTFITPEPEKVEVYEETKPQPLATPRKITTEPDLIHLSTPQEFSGSAYVINANEINIGGNSIFLYGIYVNPTSREGTLGKQFLEDLIGNEPVHCIAPAYTRQGVATAICYVGNMSLNHAMVNSGYSQNVSLQPL